MTVTVKRKAPLTVPDLVRRRAGFKPGDQVEFKAACGVVTIRKLTSSDSSEYTPGQRRVIDAKLNEAEKGPFYGPFNSVDDMIAHLKAEVKRRVEAPTAVDLSKPFPCFVLSEDAEPITLKQTLQAEDEL
jgi:bifunctional DNA-binding transcriptional regulator/antitoxin component of YhaV-PrlF toxin-antitoxin module